MAKMLYVDPGKCTGCRTCELVCSITNEGIANPVLSRVRVVADKYRGLRIPMVCQQCEDAACISVCPVGALKRDSHLSAVKLDRKRCIGCKACVVACPFGALAVDPASGRVFKCELCEGNPQCAKFCEDKAITYVEPDVLVMDKKRLAARNFSRVFEEYDSNKRGTDGVEAESTIR